MIGGGEGVRLHRTGVIFKKILNGGILTRHGQRGGSAKTPTCHRKNWQTPLSGEAGPPIHRAKQIFSVFKGFSGEFLEFSVIFP